MTRRSGRGTARQTLRIDEDLWERLGVLAKAAGTDRSTLLRDFARWAVGDPDAPTPTRLVEPGGQ